MSAAGRALAVVGVLVSAAVADPSRAAWYFVAPDGSDGAPGLSERAPLATVQKALELARPGDTVVLRPGTYRQDIATVRAGRPGAPIRIAGTADAIVRGGGSAYVVDIRHDHVELTGFTIDGLHGDGDVSADYRDKLVYIHGPELDHDEDEDSDGGITGVRVAGMRLVHARGECVRLRRNASGNEIAGNTIAHCGLGHYRFDGRVKNGEGVYVGGSARRIEVRRRDASTGNRIIGNRIEAVGECVDIKEGADGNRIERNLCLGALDPESGGISVRSNGNRIADNLVGSGRGAGIRLGGRGARDGTGNRVVGNQLQFNEGGTLKIMRLPQAAVCGNVFRQPKDWPSVRFGDAGSMPVAARCPGSAGEDPR